MRLKDKVAIVTGGGSGMGRAICQVFAREGARVAVVDMDAAAAAAVAAEAGNGARAFTADVTRTADVNAMVAAVVGHFGRLDVLVNNAGRRIIKSFLDHSDEDWEAMIGVNLRGPFLCARAAIPHMLKVGKGKVINNASIAGITGRPDRAAYCAAKGGLLALTRALATDMAGKNICVNAILPGSIETPFNATFANDPVVGRKWGEDTLVGRWGTAEEVAKAALFLATDDSDFTTGAELRVDGGWTAGRARPGEVA